MKRNQIAPFFARAARRFPGRAADFIGFSCLLFKEAIDSLLKQNGDDLVGLKLAAIAVFSFAAAHAQTCSPINVPPIIVQGKTFQPAIVNGIDQVSSNSVRFQYTLGPVLAGELSTFVISGSTATITTSVPHGYAVGGSVGISGLTGVAVGGGISSLSRTNNVTTVTTNSPHGLSTGSPYNSYVAITGVTDASFDLSGFIISAPTTTTFTIANGGNDATASGGTVTYEPPATPGNFAILSTPTATTFTINNSFNGGPYTSGAWTGQTGTLTPLTNAVQIVYATAAQWAANGNRIIAGTAGVNYSLFEGTAPLASNGYQSILGNDITNLAANTTYYIAGLASSNGGSTWCPEVDESFTTPPWTGVQKPAPPNSFSLSEPTITGTDYTVGVAPCNVGSTAGAQFADCVQNKAQPGDGVGIVPGTPVILPTDTGTPGFLNFPVPPSAIVVVPNSATSTFTSASTATLTNGEQVHVAAAYQSAPPSPINQGITYSLVNVTGSAGNWSFQISQDGTNPLTLNDNGNGYTMYIVPWPISQNYVVIHSTANAANLPPPGTRLDPVAYGQYLGVIEMSQPGPYTLFFPFTSHYWLKNVEITIAANPAAAAETDPPPSGALLEVGTMADHIVIDQSWLHGPPIPDGLGLACCIIGGNDVAIINSAMDNAENWRPTNALLAGVVTGNALALNAGSSYYGSVTPGFYSPSSETTKYTCTPSAANPITFSGSAAGSFFVSMAPSTCAITVTASAGITASGVGVTTVNSANPDYPRDTNSICLAHIGRGCYTQLNVGSGTYNGSVIASYSDTNCCGNGPAMSSNFVSAGATGIGIYDGPGPFEIVNNSFKGFSIVGPFKDQNDNNGCAGAPTACPYIYNTVDLTVQRNHFQVDPNFIITSPTWNGSWWFGRNGPEMKQGDRILYDGNIIGPVYGGEGSAECVDLFTYIGFAYGSTLNTVNSEYTADVEFRNNTCTSTGAGIQMSGGSINGLVPGQGIHKIWVHNNLFDNTNGYLQNPEPYGATSHGFGIGLTATQDVTIDHNTWAPNQAGDGSVSVGIGITQSGSLNIANNIFNYDISAAVGVNGFAFGTSGQITPIPAPPAGTQGTALLAYLHNASFNNNLMLCTWSNDQPSSLAEITQSACSTLAALYPASNYFPNSGTSLANRVAAIGWNAPLSYGFAGGNYRLNGLSPYISGGHLSSDGLDMGANIDQLEAAQGRVSDVHTYQLTSTSATIAFLAPDSQGLTVDWGTSAFWTGSGAWTRVANAGGQRAQTVALTGLPAHGLIYYRVNGAVMQPTGTVKLP